MKDFRVALIRNWIWYVFFVFLSTELLSMFNWINRSVLLGIYAVGAGVLLWIYRNKLLKLKVRFKLPEYWRWYLLLVVVVFLPLLLIALYYPPNNWDSMTYHLARVEHWIQDKNVEFYPTNNDRQLFMSPLAEYVILHWRLLAKSDNLVNLVQYFSMILSVILSTLVVKKLKSGKLSELLAAVLTATIPIGIMEATSTQNDWSSAFFVLATFYFCLDDISLYLALCVGLGFFAKSTYAIFALPIGVYWFIKQFKKDGLKVWKKIVLILVVTILINFSQWRRNYQYYGSIFGSKEASVEMFNRSFAPKYILSNMVKNIGTQIGLPNRKYDLFVDRVVGDIHQKLGVGVSDTSNSYYFSNYVTQFSINEDLSGNFVFLLLFVTCGIILILKKYRIWPYYFELFSGWILFNILLKWQPWLSRLELPFFVVCCPVLAVCLFEFIKKKWFLKSVIVIVILSSLSFIIGRVPFEYDTGSVEAESNRPLTKGVILFHLTHYERFLSESSINSSYHEVAKKISELGAKNVGLDIGGDSREYPLWVALREDGLIVNVNYIDKPKVLLSRNYDSELKDDVIISDNDLTINKVGSDQIKSKIDFGRVKMLILK